MKTIGLSWNEIAKLFGISRILLYLKSKEAGILKHFHYSEISDEDLQDQVLEIKEEMPDIGERMIDGTLRSFGIHVQRRRLREAIHTVDPLNTALHWHKKFSIGSIQFLDQCVSGI